MPTGDCFRCHQPGHWANNCPLRTNTTPTAADAAASPPAIHCPCNGRACNIFTSTTKKNPNRRFYKCPSIPSCGFFKWCDQVSIIKSESISVHPTCPCGSGPCRRVTVIDGPNAQRSYFVCSVKKGFGGCGFFQWEDDVEIQLESEQIGNDGSPCPTLIGYSGFGSMDDESLLHETHFDSDGNIKRSRLGVVFESELNLTSSNEFTIGDRVVDGIVESVTDYEKDTLPTNAVTVGKEPIPDFSGFNNRKQVSNGVIGSADGRNQDTVPSFDLITLYEDAVRLETEEQVLPSLASKHFEPQVETLCSDFLEFNGKASYASEDITDVSQNTSDSVSNGKTKLDHKHQPEHQSTTSGETEASFSGSYKQLKSLCDRENNLKKQLLEVEKQVKLYEAKTSEFAMSLQEVSGEMAKLQKNKWWRRQGKYSSNFCKTR